MGEGKGHEDTPRQAKQILMWGPSVGVIYVVIWFSRMRGATPKGERRLRE